MSEALKTPEADAWKDATEAELEYLARRPLDVAGCLKSSGKKTGLWIATSVVSEPRDLPSDQESTMMRIRVWLS